MGWPWLQSPRQPEVNDNTVVPELLGKWKLIFPELHGPFLTSSLSSDFLPQKMLMGPACGSWWK